MRREVHWRWRGPYSEEWHGPFATHEEAEADASRELGPDPEPCSGPRFEQVRPRRCVRCDSNVNLRKVPSTTREVYACDVHMGQVCRAFVLGAVLVERAFRRNARAERALGRLAEVLKGRVFGFLEVGRGS